MSKSIPEHIKGLPEQYFTIPNGDKVDVNALYVSLERISIMIDLLITDQSEGTGHSMNIAFTLEGMIYQAKEMAMNLEGVK